MEAKRRRGGALWNLARTLVVLCGAAAAQTVSADPAALPSLPDSLSEQVRAQLSAAPAPPTGHIDIEQMRAFSAQFQTQFAAKQRAKYPVSIKDDVLAGVPVSFVVPAGKTDPARVLIDLHGGGFVVDSGSLTENVPIAALSGIEVIAVHYRLAPEHPFPAAVDDALAVYRELLKKYSASHIGIYGTSAGAILGPEVIARIIAEGLPTPAALGMFSGTADLARMGDSTRLFPFQMADLDFPKLTAMYAGKLPLNTPALSPQYGSLAKFPATMCVSSGRDFLLSGTIDFCRALDRASVPTHLLVFDGLPHAFWSYIDAPESDEALRLMADFLARHLGGKVRAAAALAAASATRAGQ